MISSMQVVKAKRKRVVPASGSLKIKSTSGEIITIGRIRPFQKCRMIEGYLAPYQARKIMMESLARSEG